MTTALQKIVFFCFVLIIAKHSVGQRITIDGNVTPEAAIADVLLDQGVQASNFKYNGTTAAATVLQPNVAAFSNGSALGFPFDTGIVLSTNGNDDPLGDADLTDVATNTVRNGAVIEFDFVATGEELSFNYMFASTEYPDYVCASYNDVFAFFLSGPGITGPYSDDGENIALIPGKSVPVSINTVNSGAVGSFGTFSNCSDADPTWWLNDVFYTTDYGSMYNFKNPPFFPTAGTVVLPATANLVCGATYTIKLAIANVGDQLFDSMVFLEAGSFRTGEVSVSFNDIATTPYSDTVLVAGCQTRDIIFRRPSTLTDDPLSFEYVISGDAVEGVDFDQLNPTSTLEFAVGQDEIVLTINPINGGTIDDMKELSIKTIVAGSGCSPDQVDSTTIWLIRPPTITLESTSPPTSCGANNGVINLEFEDVPDGIYTIIHNDDEFTNVTITNGEASITGVEPGVYTNLRVKESGCNSGGVNATISDPPSASGTASADPSSICSGNTSVLELNGYSGSIQWQESPNGTTGWVNVSGGTGATTDEYTTATLTGTTYFRAVVTDGICPANESNVLTVAVENPPTAPTSITGTTTLCEGTGTTLTASGGIEGDGAVYEWGTGAVGTNVIGGETGVSLTTGNLSSNTTYWVRRVGTTSCTNTTSGVTQLVTVEEAPTAPTSITGTTTLCEGTGTTLTAAGGTEGDGAVYEWGTGAVGTNIIGGETSVSLTTGNLSSNTTYWVRRMGTTSCTNTTSGVTQLVTVEEAPTAPTSITGTTTLCEGTGTTLTAAGGTEGDGAVYEWGTGAVGTNIIGGETSVSLTTGNLSSNTTYWVRRVGTTSCTNTTSGVTQLVTVEEAPTAPTSISGVTTICENSSTTLTAVGGDNGDGAEYEWGTGTIVGVNIIPGETGVSYTTPNLVADQSYWVRRVGTSSCTDPTGGVSTTVIINNDPPLADVGVDQEICAVDVFSINATAQNGDVTWSTSDGTGVFSNINSPSTVYTPSAADISSGNVTLRMTVQGTGTCAAFSDFDELVLTINNDGNQVPVADAGAAATICAVDTYTLDGTATNGTGVWSGGTGTFSPNANDLNAVYTPSVAEITAGTVTLTLTVTGDQGTCNNSTTSDDVTITINNDVNDVPVADAGAAATICAVDTYTLDGTATNGTGVWSGGTGTFSPDANDLNAVYTPSAAEITAGTVTLTLTVTGDQGTCNTSTTSDEVTITINNDVN